MSMLDAAVSHPVVVVALHRRRALLRHVMVSNCPATGGVVASGITAGDEGARVGASYSKLSVLRSAYAVEVIP